MSNRATTIIVVFGFVAVALLTVSTFLGFRGPRGASSTGTGAVFPVGEVEYAEGIPQGYAAHPEREGQYPGIVMVHEAWGLNDNIKRTADKLSEEGYVVLAVDLLGKVAKTPEEAQAQVSSLNQAKALQSMKAAVAYLRSRGVTKVATIGWGFGGGQSLQLAMSGVPLDATVVYYPTLLVTDEVKLKAITGPVMGVFGDQDTVLPIDTVNKFKATLDKLKIINEITISPRVGHAFADPSSDNYAHKETEDAWAKMVAFLGRSLK